MAKRITFNTPTPNDQGGIIPNGVIDTTRYVKNPVLCMEHQWSSPPLGYMTDINWSDCTAVPVFHLATKESKEYAEMYEKDAVRACSIGGFSEWHTNSAGQPQIDAKGNRTCARFDLYEISLCTLPSNQDAVTTLSAEQLAKLAAPKIFDVDSITLKGIYDSITTLSSQFNNNNVKTPAQLKAEKDAADKKVKDAQTALATAQTEADTLAANNLPAGLPAVITDAINDSGASVSMFKAMGDFVKDIVTTLTGSPKEPVTAATPLPDGDKTIPVVTTPNPETVVLPDVPAKLKAEKKAAKKKAMDDAKEKASKATEAAKAAKAKADAEGADDAMKAAAKDAMDAAEKDIKAAEDAEADYNSSDDDATENSATAVTATAAEPTTNAANNPNKPVMKTPAQLRAELNLAASPDHKARIGQASTGLTFSALSAAHKKDPNSGDGRILSRVLNSGRKEISDYAIVLNSIINDPKYAALVTKTRFNQHVTAQELPALMNTASAQRPGISIEQLAAKLNAGHVSVMGRDNLMREQTTLNSTDDLLSSPDLFAVEWLPLVIFQLFPNTGWKADIPIFAAQETGKNTGLIWTNIAADPTITQGAKPVNPTPYEYSDTAVALPLSPFWLNPMLWTPLTMHQFRYDQMSTGWAQAFAKWGAIMDDYLLYLLASTVPAASIVPTTGVQFNIDPGTPNANKFYYNPAFAGSLLGPAYNDIFACEQVFNNQNFVLKQEKTTLIIDPIMERFLKQDDDMKSLLTRFVNSDGSEILKVGNTTLTPRSRAAIYNPATSQFINPKASIPSSAISASPFFVPSNVGIGLGMLDVFMQQSPADFGYLMSADTRIGLAPLRANFDGTGAFTYSPGNV